MSKEFNIFNNLDEMMKCNFLDQIRTMDAANISNGTTNDSQNNDDDFEEFDAFPNNNGVTSPTKRTRKEKIVDEVAEKTAEGNAKKRRSSSSKERSLSPPMPLLESLEPNLVDVPVSRRTRRSLERAKKTLDQTGNMAEACASQSAAQVPASSKRGRGRGRGRGAKANSSTTKKNGCLEDSIIIDDTFNHCGEFEYGTDTEYVPSVSMNSNTSTSIMERFLELGRQGSGGRRLRNRRTRRNYIAEIAARCPTLDTVDLISSPFPRVEGSITLDSDGEEEKSSICVKETTSSLDISLDDDNPELSVKINWKGKPEAFKLRKYQKFSKIFNMLAEREDTNVVNTVFNINERIISPEDTPDSIGYKIFQFISGRVLTANVNSPLGPIGLPKKKRNVNQINLKIQSDKWKRPLQINMLKSDKFRVLYIKCTEELNVGIEQIKLSFDGEPLELNDTPAGLDFEGGEAIDLRLKN